jgi:RHS repeat-associated protein
VDTNNLTGYAQVVEELQGGNVIRQYTYGNDLISQRQLIAGNWQTSWYQYDGHGSVRGLTNAAGSLTDTYTYDAFGVLIARTGTTPNLYLYAGEQYDPDLVLYYNRARYLKAETGRFWTQDSYEGDLNEPLSLHKYLYASGNVTNGIDPTGHSLALFPTASWSLVFLRSLAIGVSVALAFYASLRLTSQSISDAQRASVSRPIGLISQKGYWFEASLLKGTSFRSTPNWLTKIAQEDEAYAATNRLFFIVTLYEDYYELSELERAAVLMHESYHLMGYGEEGAYSNVWLVKEDFGYDPTNISSFWKDVMEIMKGLGLSL